MADVYVGLMSGTSLDGISAAVVRFNNDKGRIEHDLIGFCVSEYTTVQRERLLAAIRGATPQEYCLLNVALGSWLADAATRAIAESGVARDEIRAIGSHGQTLWHVPAIATWQTGEPAVIAERCGVDVVSDFRARDVAAGGHGAPLVPIADALLYASPTHWRLLQNVGGIANCTIVPSGGTRDGVRAFDTGPGMAIVDAVVRRLFPRMTYDVDGAIAATGTVNDIVINALLAHPYFAMEPPKSTGRELFSPEYAEEFIAHCRATSASDADIVATATALTARSIAMAYSQFIPEPVQDVVVSGGGAKNATLMRMLGASLSATPNHARVSVRKFDELFYDGEAKEAVAFALLAHLHVTHQPGNVTGATGARGPRVLGKLTPA